MKHTNIIFSSPETPLPDRSVGELVAERPGRSRVFQAYGIDFCCQGGRTVREACERKGISTEIVLSELERESAEKKEDEFNPAELPAHELCDHIVRKHHEHLREELPRLRAMSERVAQVHGGHTPSLVELFHVFHGMANEVTAHIQKEEEVLFPVIAAMSRGESTPESLQTPIDGMLHDHDETGRTLERLSELTNRYQPPAEACNTYRALFAGLEELEDDLKRHIHLENSVLFPVAQRMLGAEVQNS